MITKIFKATCEAGDVEVRVNVAEVEDVLVRGAPPTSVVVGPALFHVLDGTYHGMVSLTLAGDIVGSTVYRVGTEGSRVDQGGLDAVVDMCRGAVLSVADGVANFVRDATQEVLARGIVALHDEETRLEAELADVRRRIAAASELTTSSREST